ncbi:MAG: ATP-binding protein [Bacteroides sp.]|nr:ATP-binding protein [Bacteroides sp.]
MEDRFRYAIGEQNFKKLREDNAHYIDKTSFIAKIARSKSHYYFLARPRRFGKSLFLSSLEYFFRGERELFKNLYIDSIDWDWVEYPVLHIDLNTDKYPECGILDDVLNNLFSDWEAKYGITEIAEEYSQRFNRIIKTAHQATGRPVVILIDEYDKPLVGNLNNDENFEHYRARLASLYSNFKSCAEHLRLVFLTGVSRFSKLSIFSDLNNLNDISFDDDYADICGITERELRENLHVGIQGLANKMKESFEDASIQLRHNYDGYRFALNGNDIYNPWSVINCLSKQRISNYWSMTGSASVIAECLRNIDLNLEELLNTHCDFDTLVGFDLKSADPVSLLYQTGYLTIKDYDYDTDMITLGVPNREVRNDLSKVLLPLYTNIKGATIEGKIRELIASIRLGQPQKLMQTLDAFFSGIPYEMKMENENNFQNAVYILLTLIGANARVEERTSRGRIDINIETPKYVYIIELKFDGSSQDAINQINEKDYAGKYLTDQRQVFKIGASFSSKTRTIDNFIIQ